MGLGDNCKTRGTNLLRTCMEICAVPAVALNIIVHRWWSVWKCHSASKMFPNFEYHWMYCCIHQRNNADRTYLRCCPATAWTWLRCL